MTKQAKDTAGTAYVAEVAKLIHGGQGLGSLEDGRKALLWNVLPGERVEFIPKKSKSSYVEGVATEIIEVSPDRVQPRDELYLSTSPWQIVAEEKEDLLKQAILEETFARGGFGNLEIGFKRTSQFWEYRNKMEYSFYGDDEGLHLAMFNRGTHRKQVVHGSSIAMPMLDEVARQLVSILNGASIRGTSLKSVILRANQKGEVVVALFVKDEDFPKLNDLGSISRGLIVVYSNPKSPASVRTRDLYTFGNIDLSDTLAGQEISYDVFSFFQVNCAVFEESLDKIKAFCGFDKVVDFYSGVGTIGVTTPGITKLVESDPNNIIHARKNVAQLQVNVDVIEAHGEKALEHIPSTGCLIVDPPRAGLHGSVVEQILESKPSKIVYLSCNPSTQVRDLALLQKSYEVVSVEGFNFFPRTPHIESLLCLRRR